MRIGKISDTIVSLYNNDATRKRAVFLRGPSGIGKSQTVWQAAQALGIEVIDLRLSQMDPVDLRGVPSVSDDNTTVWNTPSFFPRDPKSSGVLFMDEVTSAPPAIQAAAYQLVLDRALGDYKLPDGWMIVAAGNRQSDRGVTFTMAAPLMNRFTVLDVDTTLDDWRDHAFTVGVRPEIAAFLSDRADFLHKYTSDNYGEQFPSPRSWLAASDILNMELPESTRIEMLNGVVGREAAGAFETFLRIWDVVPRLDLIFENPDAVAVPEQMNVRYCVAMGLAARMDKKTFNNAYAYLKRMPKEFQTLCVKLAYQRDPSIAQATQFSDWAENNRDAFKRG